MKARQTNGSRVGGSVIRVQSREIKLPPPRQLLIDDSIDRTDLFDDIGPALMNLPHRPPMNVLLTGDVGTGKTTLVHQLARLLERSLWILPGSEALSARTMVTVVDGVHRDEAAGNVQEVFRGTELLAAVVLGGVFFADEFSLIPDDAKNVLRELLESRILTCPENGFQFKAHKDFAFICAQNEDVETTMPKALSDRIWPRFVVRPPGRELLVDWLRKMVPEDKNVWLGAFDQVIGASADPTRTTRQALKTLEYAYRCWAWAGRPPLDTTGALAFIERARVAS